MKKVLSTFYSRYNPSKISAIDEILLQYQGEEMVLLFELAEVYNLSQSDMQSIIDESKKSDVEVESSISSVSERKSRSREPQPSRSQEFHSTGTHTWENRTTDRKPHKSQSGIGRKPPHSNEPNAYHATYDVNTLPKRLPSGGTTSSVESRTGTSSTTVTPMTLQDIINTSRRSESLATKKSVRFSPNLEVPTTTSYHTLSKSNTDRTRPDRFPSPSTTQPDTASSSGKVNSLDDTIPNGSANMLSHPVVHRDGSNAEASSSQVPSSNAPSWEHSDVAVDSISSNQDELDGPNVSVHQHQHHQQHVTGTWSSPHESPPATDRGSRGDHGGGGGSAIPRYDHQAMATPADHSSSARYTTEEGAVRTHSVGLEEMKRELERTRHALSEADRERHEVLNLLQEVAAAPYEMQEVVERYLDKYGMYLCFYVCIWMGGWVVGIVSCDIVDGVLDACCESRLLTACLFMQPTQANGERIWLWTAIALIMVDTRGRGGGRDGNWMT